MGVCVCSCKKKIYRRTVDQSLLGFKRQDRSQRRGSQSRGRRLQKMKRARTEEYHESQKQKVNSESK